MIQNNFLTKKCLYSFQSIILQIHYILAFAFHLNALIASLDELSCSLLYVRVYV